MSVHLLGCKTFNLVPRQQLGGVSYSLGVWLDAIQLEVLSQLLRNFCQYFLGKKIGVILKLVKWNKLDYVSFLLAQRLTKERDLITVKLIHLTEVSVSNTNDNNRKRVVGSSDNLIDCLVSVIDYSVSQNKQNGVLLVKLIRLSFGFFSEAVDEVDDA